MKANVILFSLEAESLDNDIRSLIMAFFPGASIARTEEGSCPEGCELYIKVLSEEREEIEVSAEDKREAFYQSERIPLQDPSDRKEIRNRAKQILYRLLVSYTGVTLPWGTLTGIRPTKIARTMLMAGDSEADVISYMEDEMLCSKEKTDFSLEIAKREIELLSRLDYEKGYSIYIGIPFCPTTCAYCSFTSYPISRFEKQVDAYLDAVMREIDLTAELFKGKTLNTIYFGGGTPTTLSPDQLDRLLIKVERTFDLSSVLEWTVEAGRPDSITREKLEVIKKHPVTRISINPQTMKQETLDKIGRKHTVDQIREAYALARTCGFDNINMDMIVGLPDETASDVEHTLQEIEKLSPDSLTVHSLAIKRAARMNIQKEAFRDSKSVNNTELMELCRSYAQKMNMVPYYLYRQKNMTGNLENVGYSDPSKMCIYNILIMEEVQTIVAMGAGAISKRVDGDRIERCENAKDIKTYLENHGEMLDRKKKLFEKSLQSD